MAISPIRKYRAAIRHSTSPTSTATLFVTYAKQDAQKHDDVAGACHGFVDVFDTDGHLGTITLLPPRH